MCDYPDLYLKTGTLLLADVIEKFINTCLEYYGFRSLSFFFSSPALNRNIMLKMTEIVLERISNIEMYLFF